MLCPRLLAQDGYRGRILYLPSAAQGAADEAWAALQESLKVGVGRCMRLAGRCQQSLKVGMSLARSWQGVVLHGIVRQVPLPQQLRHWALCRPGALRWLPCLLPTCHSMLCSAVLCHALLQGVRVWHELHRSRIGLVGQPSSW